MNLPQRYLVIVWTHIFTWLTNFLEKKNHNVKSTNGLAGREFSPIFKGKIDLRLKKLVSPFWGAKQPYIHLLTPYRKIIGRSNYIFKAVSGPREKLRNCFLKNLALIWLMDFDHEFLHNWKVWFRTNCFLQESFPEADFDRVRSFWYPEVKVW